MAQNVKFVDVTRSYIPVDPKAFPQNLIAPRSEDAPEDAPLVAAYEGWNFLPTSYGYKSYFGTNAAMAIGALSRSADYVLLYQTGTFQNILVALCDNGIWINRSENADAWEHVAEQDVVADDVVADWSYCILNRGLYLYRAGALNYWKIFFTPSADLLGTFDFVGAISAVAMPTVTGFPAGTREFRVSYANADGWYSSESEPVSVTTATAEAITISWPAQAGATAYRVYATKDEVTEYFDVPATDLQYYYAIVPADGTTSIPDASWVESVEEFYLPVSVTPTFLNMEGQIGIFSAGTRLGFWDSEDSIGWSSIDDYAEFTPSIQTLAGSAVFSDVAGRIISIHSHGEGFIIYATKSIVVVNKAVEATFMWDPKKILDVGVSYPKQVTVNDTGMVHYAYTNSGIYNIEEGRQQLIIPAIYDFFKKSSLPVYISMLENRYLAFHVMDPEYILGNVQFVTDSIPATTITFPQDLAIGDLGDPIELVGNDTCYTLQGLNHVHQGAGAGSASDDGFDFGPLWNSLYRTYYSFGGIGGPIEWGPTPCPTLPVPSGPDLEFNPTVGRVTDVTQDGTNKYIVEDNPVEFWFRQNTEKFVATQTALWRLADEALAAHLQEITSKTYTGQVSLQVVGSENDTPDISSDNFIVPSAANSCPLAVNPAEMGVITDICDIGDFITAFGGFNWGFSNCGMYLTRYVTGKATLSRVTTVTTTCTRETYSGAEGAGWFDITNGAGYGHATPEDVIRKRIELFFPTWVGQPVRYDSITPYNGLGYALGPEPGAEYVNICAPQFFLPGKAEVTRTTKHYLVLRNPQTGIFGVDTAYMELMGWYNSDDITQIVPADASCTPPAYDPEDPPSSSSGGMPISDIDGTICGIPFDPITLPALSPDPIEWPSQSVTYPPAIFLLQEGSIAPKYPTFYGAYVYDTHLEKWGKYKGEYKLFVNYQALNGQVGSVVPYATFGINAGILDAMGLLYLFDAAPEDSYITYGKIGYQRLGFTNVEEVKVQFASLSDCKIAVQGSLDGKNLEATLIKEQALSNEMTGTLFANMSTRWYNITISGTYDISYIEFRGTRSARR